MNNLDTVFLQFLNRTPLTNISGFTNTELNVFQELFTEANLNLLNSITQNTNEQLVALHSIFNIALSNPIIFRNPENVRIIFTDAVRNIGAGSSGQQKRKLPESFLLRQTEVDKRFIDDKEEKKEKARLQRLYKRKDEAEDRQILAWRATPQGIRADKQEKLRQYYISSDKIKKEKEEYNTAVENARQAFEERRLILEEQEQARLAKIQTETDKSMGRVQYENCPICLDPINDGQPVCMLSPCLHILHCACIASSILRNNQCPICRSAILQNNIVNLPYPPNPPENGFGKKQKGNLSVLYKNLLNEIKYLKS